MVKQIVEKLRTHRSNLDILLLQYSKFVDAFHSTNAAKNIRFIAPKRASKFFETLNIIKNDSRFPTQELNFEEMIEILESEEKEIEFRITFAIDESEAIALSGIGLEDPGKVLMSQLNDIESSANMATVYLNLAKLKASL